MLTRQSFVSNKLGKFIFLYIQNKNESTVIYYKNNTRQKCMSLDNYLKYVFL